MPEAFSINDLKKAMTKASFLKVAGAAGSREESSLDREKEDAVLLEPVFGEEEGTEAVVLTSEEEDENIRSSWEIPSKEDLDQEESFNSKQGIDIEKKKKPAERVSDKERIFDRMDEIDNLIQSLNEDIAGDSPFGARQPVSETLQNEELGKESSSGDLFGVENDGSDDIFSSEYQFSDEEEDRTVEIVSEQEEKRESASAIMEDFESIVSEGSSVQADDEDFESIVSEDSSVQADDEESGPLILEKEEPESPPEEEHPEELSAEYDISEDTGESEEAEMLGEVEVAPVEEVEAEPVEDYKNEIHAWLEKNGRKIIKEVIEEQLSKIWEKK
jgi:hypothetical protein